MRAVALDFKAAPASRGPSNLTGMDAIAGELCLVASHVSVIMGSVLGQRVRKTPTLWADRTRACAPADIVCTGIFLESTSRKKRYFGSAHRSEVGGTKYLILPRTGALNSSIVTLAENSDSAATLTRRKSQCRNGPQSDGVIESCPDRTSEAFCQETSRRAFSAL